MPYFEIVGYARGTGRKRVRSYHAKNQEDAILMASADGTIVQMDKIRQLPEAPPEPATAAQISYAKDLGIKFSPDVSKAEMTGLISRAVEEKENQENHTIVRVEVKQKQIGFWESLWRMGKKICPNCGTIASPRLQTQGSFIFEVLLWLLFILPGLIYTMWRRCSRKYVCPRCGALNMVPLDSPRGKILQLQFGQR